MMFVLLVSYCNSIHSSHQRQLATVILIHSLNVVAAYDHYTVSS